MQVQTTWTYIESIFGASAEDVRRKLPTHTALFDSVHAAFKQAMASIFASRASAVQVQSLLMNKQSLAHEPWHFCMSGDSCLIIIFSSCRPAPRMGCWVPLQLWQPT